MNIKNMPKYPTKEEIIKHCTLIKEEMIDLTKKWKKIYYTKKWKSYSNKEKHWCLYMLATYLNYFMKTKEIVKVNLYKKYAATPKTNTLFFDETAPSIMSTLHEIGHLIYGLSETKACAFSYQLFNTVFPNECKNLQWEGHMLVKKQNKECNN